MIDAIVPKMSEEQLVLYCGVQYATCDDLQTANDTVNQCGNYVTDSQL